METRWMSHCAAQDGHIINLVDENTHRKLKVAKRLQTKTHHVSYPNAG